MTFVARCFVPAALLLVSTGVGCSSLAGWGDDDGEPRRWSEEWYAIRADEPVGAPQKFKKGKLWPPFPRPTGEGQTCWHRYHSAHYWPYPYNCLDRGYVYELTETQVNNGWIQETTLYDYHFNDEQGTLDDSGRLHLQWILMHAPACRRVVWVQTGREQHVSQQRLAIVQAEAAQLVGESDLPPIMLRVASPVSRPAIEVDRISEAYLETMPDPRIAYESLPTGTSGAAAP